MLPVRHIFSCKRAWLTDSVVDFDVSDGFLMKIYKPAPTSSLAPAPTSSESESTGENSSEENQDEPPEEVDEVYLVEPMRLTSSVIKFSGTLGSTTRTDLRSSTMAAFAHYVAQETASQFIFADIQGPYSYLILRHDGV